MDPGRRRRCKESGSGNLTTASPADGAQAGSIRRPVQGDLVQFRALLRRVEGWYLRYPLAYEHVAELLAERGVEVDPS